MSPHADETAVSFTLTLQQAQCNALPRFDYGRHTPSAQRET